MAARVQLPPIQDVGGRYRSGVTVIGVTDTETEDAVAVYNAPIGGSVITFPSPGVTSGEEGELEAWTAANTVDVELDADDDTYDNPTTVELVSWGAITDYIDLQPFSASTGVPGVNVRDEPYDATGDGSTDDWAAIQQAIEDAPDLGIDSIPYDGWRVVLPPGEYRISQPIVINRPGTHLLGTGRSRNISGSTVIRPDDGVKGIIVKHPTGVGGSLGQSTVDPSDTSRGDDCILENFAVAPLGNSVGSLDIHGIDVKMRCVIKHVSVGNGSLNGFNGNGINMNASVSTGNCSQSTLIDVRAEGNLGSGFSVFGNDSSACVFITCSSDLNGINGFRESSFLGNTYIGCHTRGNGQIDAAGVGYNFDSSSIGIGCYTEGGQDENIMDHVGATWLAPHGVYGSPGDLPDITGTVLSTNDGFVQSTQGFQARFATSRGIGNATFGFTENTLVDVDNGDDDALQFVWNDTHKCWRWEVDGTRFPLDFTTTADDERTGVSYTRFDDGFLLGDTSLTTRHSHGTGAPGSGAHLKGDIVFNRDPSGGEFVGWICTTAGSPGTWKGFGAIEA